MFVYKSFLTMCLIEYFLYEKTIKHIFFYTFFVSVEDSFTIARLICCVKFDLIYISKLFDRPATSPKIQHLTRHTSFRLPHNHLSMTKWSDMPLKNCVYGQGKIRWKQLWWLSVRLTPPFPLLLWFWRCELKVIPTENKSWEAAIRGLVWGKQDVDDDQGFII